MKEQKEKDVVWPIRMKKEFKEKFKKYCQENGYSMNKRVRVLIEMDMDNNGR